MWKCCGQIIAAVLYLMCCCAGSYIIHISGACETCEVLKLDQKLTVFVAACSVEFCCGIVCFSVFEQFDLIFVGENVLHTPAFYCCILRESCICR